MKIIILMFALCISSYSICFFWVPNRYTSPYWAGDTHITNQCISSCDIYLDNGFTHNNVYDYTSINTGLSLYQTIHNGFFIEATIPATHINLKTKIEPLIQQHGGLCYENSTILIGWGINYDMLLYIDFVDFMIRTGYIFPAHGVLNPLLHTESLYGYQEPGIPGAIDIACGFCEWMSFGVHTSICYIHNNPLIWSIAPYFKADHLMRGLSFWVGYAYTGSEKSNCLASLFFTDTQWTMHTMHYGIELELIQSEFPLHPRIGAFYTQCIGGTNILKQDHVGISVGLDIIW